MTKQILVFFEGNGSGVGDLTWGQADIWAAMQREGSSLSLGGAFALPAGTTVDDVAADLRFLMSRHASLRTMLRVEDGRLRQVAAAAGQIALEVTDPEDADPGEVAAGLYGRYSGKIFDHFREWPILWSVVARGGTATHLVTVISHLATDGMGAMAMLADLARRDPVTGQAEPSTAMQPLELAAREVTPAARRQSAAALTYWEKTLRAMPAQRWTPPADGPRRPRYWLASYDSPAALAAARVLAARTRATTGTVLLAAWAIALTRITGTCPAVIQTVVNNRFRRGLADVVSPLCISIPAVIDPDGPFDQVVARAWRAALNAYKLSYYDPADREALIAVVEHDRREALDLSCFVNDRRMTVTHEPDPGSSLPEPGEILAALPRSGLTWGWQRDLPCERCFLHVNDIADSLNVDLYADTAYVAPDTMEACLRGLETVLIDAALKPSALGPAPGTGADTDVRVP
jgi:Condensation domain